MAVLIIGMFMSLLDTSIVNVAIDTIQDDFGATTDDVQWVVTAYMLTLGVVVPATAWLGDRFGLSRVYNLSLLMFSAASALCGLAWDLNSLVIFRIVQAIPGGILPVIALTMVYRIVPRDRLGAAMGLYGLGIVVAPAIGPTLGGYLVEYQDWPLIFFINVPIGLIGMVAAVLVLPRFPRQAGRRLDVLGFAAVASGFFSLLLAASEGTDWGWYSYRILGLITFGVLSLALFVVIELEVADPLLDLRVFRSGAFTLSLLLVSTLSVVLFGVLFYIPLVLQRVQDLGALDTGLTVLPQALVMAALMPLAGRIYDRIGPRWPAVIGLGTAASATYLLHTMTVDTSREEIMWSMMLLGFGIGLSMMPIFTVSIAVIPMTKVNVASALNNVAQRVSGSLGLSVLTALLTIHQAEQLAGRADLVPAVGGTPVPDLGPATPDWLSQYYTYEETDLRSFVGAVDNLFLTVSVLSALAALVALLLPSRSALTAAAARSTPPQQPTPPAASDGGGPVEPDLVPSGTAAGDGDPARQTDERGGDARPRDT